MHPMTPSSPHHPLPQHSEALIVGAGPTGLTLAIELARRGAPFRLIDREAEQSENSRAIGTQARTVEVFRVMGIPEAALEPAARPRALRFAERDRTLARISFGDNLPGAPRLISMDESDTERVLERRLEQLGGRVERSTQLLGFRVDGDRVTATLQDPTARRRLKHGSWSAPMVRTARFAMRQGLGSRERPIRSASCSRTWT